MTARELAHVRRKTAQLQTLVFFLGHRSPGGGYFSPSGTVCRSCAEVKDVSYVISTCTWCRVGTGVPRKRCGQAVNHMGTGSRRCGIKSR